MSKDFVFRRSLRERNDDDNGDNDADTDDNADDDTDDDYRKTRKVNSENELWLFSGDLGSASSLCNRHWLNSTVLHDAQKR